MIEQLNLAAELEGVGWDTVHVGTDDEMLEAVSRRGSPPGVRLTSNGRVELQRCLANLRSDEAPSILGISFDTLRRISRGGIVRRSTAERLLRRLRLRSPMSPDTLRFQLRLAGGEGTAHRFPSERRIRT